MQSNVAIIGAGGLGKELAAMMEGDKDYSFCGFFDDNSKHPLVLGGVCDIDLTSVSHNLMMGISDTKVKQDLVTRLFLKSSAFMTYRHQTVYEGNNIDLGVGVVIAPGSYLTTDVTVGSYVLINLNCTIGHDVSIGAYSSLMPAVNISGNVNIGQGVLIGTGAQVLQGIKIGDCATIGAGAVVTRDVAEGAIVKGIPAR